MIRPFTCVCALLAGASGLYLYSEKHRTTLLDQHISKVVADTQLTRERTAILRAEWELLNQPDRLGALAARYLPQLQPMAPTQFVQLASLATRLPPPGPETPPHPIVTPLTAPGLVGQTGAPAPAPSPTTSAPAPGTAMASADSQLGPAHHANAVVPAHHETQLADAETGAVAAVLPQAAPHRVVAHAATRADTARSDAARMELARADAVRRAWAHNMTRAAQPARYAANDRASIAAQTEPAVSVASYSRPTIAAAAWRPAHAGWPAPRPVSYVQPASAMAVGSALGGGRTALAAPVPLADGN